MLLHGTIRIPRIKVMKRHRVDISVAAASKKCPQKDILHYFSRLVISGYSVVGLYSARSSWSYYL